MAVAFLSYAREDLPFVRRLAAALQARNREVWVDLEDVIPSARWREEIRTGITTADAVVFVITPDSVASVVCREELDYATEAPKRLVPIIARKTSTASVPQTLAELSWLSFLDDVDFEAGVDRLVEVLDTDIDQVHLYTRLLTRAREWEARGHDRSLLLRGGDLRAAETWLADQVDRTPAVSAAQVELIQASRSAATRRQRGLGVMGVLMAVVLAVLTVFSVIQRQAAQERQRDVTARQLVAQASAIQDNNPRTALMLSIAAARAIPTVRLVPA